MRGSSGAERAAFLTEQAPTLEEMPSAERQAPSHGRATACSSNAERNASYASGRCAALHKPFRDHPHSTVLLQPNLLWSNWERCPRSELSEDILEAAPHSSRIAEDLRWSKLYQYYRNVKRAEQKKYPECRVSPSLNTRELVFPKIGSTSRQEENESKAHAHRE